MDGIIKVQGGNPLVGDVVPIANKNSIVAALPASILSTKPITYHNVPDTSDVKKILQLLELLGANITNNENGTIVINCANVNSSVLDLEIGKKFRASIMFAGPLLARFGMAEVPVPGGCILGKRSIAAHVDAFEKVGVKVKFMGEFVRFVAPKKLDKFYRIWQLEASVTATENLLMYAAGVKSSFEIIDAATEPHVVDLENMLARMGVPIEGLGSNRIVVHGDTDLDGAEFVPGPDFVDIAGYFVAAAVTKGNLRIKGANDYFTIGGIVDWFRMFNLKIEEDGKDLVVSGENELKISSSAFPSAGIALPKLSPRPWPGFPVDVIPTMVTLACKTSGRTLIQNWMYESGLDFSRELNNLGAEIFMADPQRLIVTGPVRFKGGKVVSPKIIQACKALFLASLADPVETTLHGVNILLRRYPDIFSTYKSIGADIEVL